MQQNFNEWKQQVDDDDDAIMDQVPLHLAQRNLLASQCPFKNQDSPSSDTIIVFRMNDKDAVLFPSARTVEILEKNRECTEDDRPETLEALEEIRRRALVQTEKEGFSARANLAEAQNSNAPSTSSRGQNTGGKVEKNTMVMMSNFQSREGYSDTYDWDHHHDVDPNFTFSKERHNQRMAMCAQMQQFQTPGPFVDVNLPFQINPKELFDNINSNNRSSVNDEFQSTTPDKH